MVFSCSFFAALRCFRDEIFFLGAGGGTRAYSGRIAAIHGKRRTVESRIGKTNLQVYIFLIIHTIDVEGNFRLKLALPSLF